MVLPSNAELRGRAAFCAVPLERRVMPLAETENGNDGLQEHV